MTTGRLVLVTLLRLRISARILYGRSRQDEDKSQWMFIKVISWVS